MGKTMLASFVSREQSSLEQTKRSIYVLLAVTVVSATFEFCFDIYLFSLSAEDVGDCLVLSSNDDAGTQLLRIILSVVSYLCPVWAAAYVFYVIPRHQFRSNSDAVTLDGGVIDYDRLNDQDIMDDAGMLDEEDFGGGGGADVDLS